MPRMRDKERQNTVIGDFATWLRNADRSSHTIRSYVGTVSRFATWFEQINNAVLVSNLITPADVRLYRDKLIQARMQPASVNATLAAIRAFGVFVAEQTGGTDPAKQLRGVETAKRCAPKSLTRQQLFKLHQAMDRRRAHAEHTGHELAWILRDEVMVQLMLNTGLRVQELCSLNIDDVRLNERGGKIIVRHGKGRKYREVPLNTNVRGPLRKWLALRQDIAAERESALFVSKYRVRMGTESVRYLLRHLSQASGVSVSPHCLRHVFAKQLIDAGESIDRVGELLGHSSLDTTRIYTAPTEADLARAVARLEN